MVCGSECSFELLFDRSNNIWLCIPSFSSLIFAIAHSKNSGEYIELCVWSYFVCCSSAAATAATEFSVIICCLSTKNAHEGMRWNDLSSWTNRVALLIFWRGCKKGNLPNSTQVYQHCISLWSLNKDYYNFSFKQDYICYRIAFHVDSTGINV